MALFANPPTPTGERGVGIIRGGGKAANEAFPLPLGSWVMRRRIKR